MTRAFTLIEVLASVVILALLSVAVAASVRFGSRVAMPPAEDWRQDAACVTSQLIIGGEGTGWHVEIMPEQAHAGAATKAGARWIAIRPTGRYDGEGLLRLLPAGER